MSGGIHAGTCLRHRRYHLDCAEFVVLLATYEDRCGICGIHSTEACPPRLVIDHDHKRGDWAVRGLLCNGCNWRIRDTSTPPPEAEEYLANPWYVRRLAERGLSAVPMREPAIGTVVSGRVHSWERTGRGWEMVNPNMRLRSLPATWRGLNHSLGPWNIRIVRKAEKRKSRAA